MYYPSSFFVVEFLDVLGKYSKIKIGIFCVQGHEGGGRGQSGGKKDTKVFKKSVFFKNHIESF